jgi:hypothetical protein
MMNRISLFGGTCSKKQSRASTKTEMVESANLLSEKTTAQSRSADIPKLVTTASRDLISFINHKSHLGVNA